jgi:glutathione S-transferase
MNWSTCRSAHTANSLTCRRQPFAKVPGFEHDGFALYETQAIMRYVDERFPGTPLQPEDVHA